MRLTPSDPDIATIVARINSGDLDLQPDFQRGEVWSASKKKKLIDSVLRNWHIPPIHVVVSAEGKQEVLDGQQRLVAIRDFVNGELRVDGKVEPLDPQIEQLHGLTYKQLPVEVRRNFDQFTIRMFRLTDYSPEEPGELFYRLNQITNLTAAEQRNAFFGPVRNQVRTLVRGLEKLQEYDGVGFSNRRMAYDDVLAKLLCVLEEKTFASKIGSSDLSNRFRSGRPFPDADMRLVEDCISLLEGMSSEFSGSSRFNKATLFSWLGFLTYFVRANASKDELPRLKNFYALFEEQRHQVVKAVEERVSRLSSFPPSTERGLLRLFTDRASFRVADVSSVVMRDVVLWVFFGNFSDPETIGKLLPLKKCEILNTLLRALHVREREYVGAVIDQHVPPQIWGRL